MLSPCSLTELFLITLQHTCAHTSVGPMPVGVLSKRVNSMLLTSRQPSQYCDGQQPTNPIYEAC